MRSEEVENLDELSPSTLKSYVKKAKLSRKLASDNFEPYYKNPTEKTFEIAKKYARISSKRTKGIAAVKDRMEEIKPSKNIRILDAKEKWVTAKKIKKPTEANPPTNTSKGSQTIPAGIFAEENAQPSRCKECGGIHSPKCRPRPSRCKECGGTHSPKCRPISKKVEGEYWKGILSKWKDEKKGATPKVSNEEIEAFDIVSEFGIEPLNELSNDKLRAYLKKAKESQNDAMEKDKSWIPQTRDKAQVQYLKRYIGRKAAMERLHKYEETDVSIKDVANELNELSNETLSNYWKKATAKVSSFKYGPSGSTTDIKKVNKRAKGRLKAASILHTRSKPPSMNEEESIKEMLDILEIPLSDEQINVLVERTKQKGPLEWHPHPDRELGMDMMKMNPTRQKKLNARFEKQRQERSAKRTPISLRIKNILRYKTAKLASN